MSPRSLFISMSLISMLCACQQAAWKAGASADDFRRDEQVCRAQAHEDSNVTRECLRGKGWTVADLRGAVDEGAEVAGDNAAIATLPPNSSIALPLNSSVSQMPVLRDVQNAAADTHNVAGDTVPANIAKTAAVSNAPNPLQRHSVQAWWKAGAQAADFNNDVNACVEKLGEQHAPDYQRHLYTLALTNCLRERGWYAGSDPVYTPLR
jgi:hypothetical protein